MDQALIVLAWPSFLFLAHSEKLRSAAGLMVPDPGQGLEEAGREGGGLEAGRREGRRREELLTPCTLSMWQHV